MKNILFKEAFFFEQNYFKAHLKNKNIFIICFYTQKLE